MVRISGFFCSHGDYSFNTIKPIIEETRSTFSHEGRNVYIKEHRAVTFAQRTSKIGLSEASIDEIFSRSATEKDLYRLQMECEFKTPEERQAVRTASERLLRKTNSINPTWYSKILWELSQLRKNINFQLLYESGTTTEINDLLVYSDVLREKLRSKWAIDFGAYVDTLVEYYYLIYCRLASLREELVRQKIDDLITRHSELNIQVVFGTWHKNMLDSYQSRSDVSLRVVVLDEPGVSLSISLMEAINKGSTTVTENNLLYLMDTMDALADEMTRKSGIITDGGDFFEILHPLLSVWQLKSFFCHDKEKQLVRVANLFKEVGALDVLKSRNFKAAEFLRILADRPVVLAARKPLVRVVGRNEPCYCGSGKKYKKCCGK